MANFLTFEDEIVQIVEDITGCQGFVGWPDQLFSTNFVVLPSSGEGDDWLDFETGSFCSPDTSVSIVYMFSGDNLSFAYRKIKEWLHALVTNFPDTEFQSGGRTPTFGQVKSPGWLDDEYNLLAVQIPLQTISTSME